MKIRIRFSKHGSVRFIGHLDIMRYFQKAIRRADIPVAYSQGYHPHQQLTFASPLGVGLESDGEYLDIEIETETISDTAAIKDALQGQMAEGIDVLSARILPEKAANAMSIVAAADYRVSWHEGKAPCAPDKMQALTVSFLQQASIPVLKKSKKKERIVDIRPMIYKLYADNGNLLIRCASGSEANLKPQQLLEALLKSGGLEYDPYGCQITRLDLYAKGADGRLISLEKYDG